MLEAHSDSASDPGSVEALGAGDAPRLRRHGAGRRDASGSPGARLLAQLGQAVIVAFAVVSVVFFLVRLVPGDPASQMLGFHATPQAVAALRAQMNLNHPLLVSYGIYLGQLLHGDLGHSIVQAGTPVTQIVARTLPVTCVLIAMTILLSVIGGVSVGLTAALTRRNSVDNTIRGSLVLLLSAPPFFVGLLLILVFALRWGVLPAGGWGNGWPGNLRYLILPSIALSCYLMPLIARTVRQVAADTTEEQFIESAISRGLTRRSTVLRHVLPNSMLPVITLLGLNIGALIAGAVIIESVFALPGIGSALVQAVNARDYPVIQGIAVISALFVVASNLIADALYVLADPRTRR